MLSAFVEDVIFTKELKNVETYKRDIFYRRRFTETGIFSFVYMNHTKTLTTSPFAPTTTSLELETCACSIIYG